MNSKELYERLDKIYDVANSYNDELDEDKAQPGPYYFVGVKDKYGSDEKDDWLYWQINVVDVRTERHGWVTELRLGTNIQDDDYVVAGEYGEEPHQYEHWIKNDNWEHAIHEAEKWVTFASLQIKGA